MKIINKIINNIPVRFIKTKKFKSVIGTIYLVNEIKSNETASNKLLRDVMYDSCKKYDSNSKLNRNCMENYDAYYGACGNRIGNYLINEFYFETLKDEYTEKGNLEKVIDTFCEIVFNPNVKDGKFDEKIFNKKKKRIEEAVLARKENQRNYASHKVLEYLNQNKPYTYDVTLENLNKITPESLYDYYNNMIENTKPFLIFVGDIDENDKVYEKITSKLNNNIKLDKKVYINNDNEVDEYKTIIEKGTGTQNIIDMVGYIKNATHYELNYVLILFKMIYGSTGTSRLFKTVREKNSLAYSCFARTIRQDGLIHVIAGIEKDNFDKTISIINEELKKMNKITDEELINAKKEVVSSLKESQDNIFNVSDREFYSMMENLPSIDEYINKLNNVTKEEVENITNKIEMKLTYFLTAEGNNGED